MKDVWLQVTAGQGPVECAWAVMKVVETIQREAGEAGLSVHMLEVKSGPATGTAQSVVLSLDGIAAAEFSARWRGAVQWVARSPFRPGHQRKNWFVGVEVLEAVEEVRFRPDEVRWETMRAGGPGGQHVNRTESAVRVTHLPTGLQASASGERSQHRNRRLALARLQGLIGELAEKQRNEARAATWRLHRALERGNPVRVLKENT